MEGDAVENIWEVSIKRLESSTDGFPQSFRVRAKNIVLATGTSDIPNVLGVPGEDLKFIRHGVSKVSAALHHIDNETRCNPVLVIGAGLSAADAIITARKNNCNIVHVFRETPCGNPAQMLKSLPRAIYPEYVMMYELMCGDVTVDWYKPYPQYAVKAFIDKNRVRLESLQGRSEIIDVSLALVQIGSNADLSFMPSQGTNLGVVPGMKIEVKHNVVDVDPFTSESVIEKGLYAMGPLIGDNFVRFLKGGAMAITQHIQMKNGVINM
ncbi:OSGIN1 [Bugula neritina]|uniref:OSGIN1 n=1 Tax=Bugula neritina TaxID=10212 RepID=A0A7J7JXI0_BUGNE|nr:OSGIN1 [Bugula neritina]